MGGSISTGRLSKHTTIKWVVTSFLDTQIMNEVALLWEQQPQSRTIQQRIGATKEHNLIHSRNKCVHWKVHHLQTTTTIRHSSVEDEAFVNNLDNI